MNYSSLRITAFAIVGLFLTNFCSAQSNYYKLSAGFGLGPNFSNTDVVKGKTGSTIYGYLDYNVTPFLTAGLEVQKGSVKGGDVVTDPNNRFFNNSYTAFNANVKFMMGEILNYNYNGRDFLSKIRGLYAGIGIGVINNSMKDIGRYQERTKIEYPPLGYKFPGEDKSMNVAIPLNMGFNYYIYDGWGYVRYALNVNIQSNITLGEGLDGYNDPSTKFENYNPDIYNAYTIGFKYFFGPVKVYRKSL